MQAEWQVVGHEWAVRLLQRAVAAGRVAHAYLFVGPPNIGKTHLARELAASLVCASEQPPCNACRACARARQGQHPDVSLVEPDGGRLKIAQVRALQRELSLSPYEARWRVCIVTDFHTATVEAANALLKTLEEPPGHVVLILTANDASTLLPTVVSRCQVLSLRAVPLHQVVEALSRTGRGDEDTLRLIASLSGGRLGWALRVSQNPALLSARRQDIEALERLLQAPRADKILAAEQLGARNDLPELMRLWQTWWRDLGLVLCGCEDWVMNRDCLEALHRHTRRYGLSQAERSMRALEETLQQLEQNVSPRLALEVLLLGWPQGAAA
jgi:DNA polymerase-3 subunit delta'